MDHLQQNWDLSNTHISDERTQTLFGEKMESKFPRHSAVLDLGGGGGIDACYFLRQGHTVTVLDISDAGLSGAQKRAEKEGLADRLTTVRATLGEERVPLEDGSVNVVYSRLALHYFTEEQTVGILKEIDRVLAPGGSFFAIVKSPRDTYDVDFLKRTAREIEPGVFDDRGVIKSRFESKKWREMLARARMGEASVHDYIEDFSGRNDHARSGASELLCHQITYTKS